MDPFLIEVEGFRVSGAADDAGRYTVALDDGAGTRVERTARRAGLAAACHAAARTLEVHAWERPERCFGVLAALQRMLRRTKRVRS